MTRPLITVRRSEPGWGPRRWMVLVDGVVINPTYRTRFGAFRAWFDLVQVEAEANRTRPGGIPSREGWPVSDPDDWWEDWW